MLLSFCVAACKCAAGHGMPSEAYSGAARAVTMAAIFIVRIMSLTAVLRVLLLFLVVPLAFAQERVDLYQVEILVPSQSQSERNKAAVEGLAEVIRKATGQPGALEHPQVVEAMRRASNYLVEWRYDSTDQTLEVNDRQVAAWRLVLRYSSNGIEALLREARLPIWPANRPTVLVWLMADTSSGRRIVNSSFAPEMSEMLDSLSRQRGLPIIRPLMDLEDQVALSPSSLWALDYDSIRRASERYGPDSILVGRLTELSSSQWRASWSLTHRGRNMTFDTQGASAQDVMAAALDQAVSYYVGLYAIIPQEGTGEAIIFQVDGVEDFAAYVRLNNYLEGMAAIRRFDVVAALGGSLLIYVYPAGEAAVLRDALALDERLVVIPELSLAGVPPGSPGNPLRYRWR